MMNLCKHTVRPYGDPFKTHEIPPDDKIRRYGMHKCPDCGKWFPYWDGIRVREKLKTTQLEGQHYWKVRVPKNKKLHHYIGTSRITHIIERQIGTVTLADAFLDGFRGNITDMKEALLRLGGGDWYWQIYYTPNWGYRERYRQVGIDG
jgi:hypothetical protein